jgi:hypothetical protein
VFLWFLAELGLASHDGLGCAGIGRE